MLGDEACFVMMDLEIIYYRKVKSFSQELILNWFTRSEQDIKASLKQNEISAEFDEKIKPTSIVALKGIDYARYWPNSAWREFGDLDCYVDSNTVEIDRRAVGVGADVKN